jgi:drug/metabolite transporter (DMT)-like permease
MRRGVLYGLLAGALWGMVFLVPRLLGDFSPVLLSAGRYVMYGIVSVLALLPMAHSVMARLTREDFFALVRFALVGNLLYYVLLGFAVHEVGVAATSLIIGVLPVSVTLIGRSDHGSVPLARLAWPLSMVLVGIACINADVFGVDSAPHASILTRCIGMVCATGALACWTWYAVQNARYLRRTAHFTGNEWSMLWGAVTGLLGLLLWLLILLLPAGWVQHTVPPARWQVFWLVNLLLAIGASWLGNALWNAASRRLPLTLAGQLLVFETLFALLYAFIYDHRWPRPLEIAAIVLLMAGVSCLRGSPHSPRSHAFDG